MRVVDRLRVESSTVRLFTVTFVGIGAELIALIPTLSYAITIFSQGSPSVIQYLTPFYTILGVYLLLPVVYCVIVSFAFYPKRIVSPVNIQIGTVVIGGFIVLDHIIYPYTLFGGFPSPQIVQLTQNF